MRIVGGRPARRRTIATAATAWRIVRIGIARPLRRPVAAAATTTGRVARVGIAWPLRRPVAAAAATWRIVGVCIARALRLVAAPATPRRIIRVRIRRAAWPVAAAPAAALAATLAATLRVVGVGIRGPLRSRIAGVARTATAGPRLVIRVAVRQAAAAAPGFNALGRSLAAYHCGAAECHGSATKRRGGAAKCRHPQGQQAPTKLIVFIHLGAGLLLRALQLLQTGVTGRKWQHHDVHVTHR